MSDQPRPPSMPPQPFRFWLPYKSNVGSWRQQPRPPMPLPPRPQPPGPPPPTPAEPAPRAPAARAVEEDIPIQADRSDESDTIAVEALDSLRLRGTRPAMADLELTLSRSPPPPHTGPEQGTSGGVDRGNDGAKISISGFPRTRLFDGARAPFRREIEDGLKSLAGRETPAPSPPDVGNQGYRVFTLAGHNVGASMVLGNGSSGAPPPRTAAESEESARPPSVAANVNSNVQGVNNSAMEESTCNSGDPGVRVDIKNAHEDRVALGQGKEEGEEKPEEPARTPPPQAASGGEASPAPPKTRRCLRALMIEERKPKPTACRFQCVADHAPPPPATASDPGGNKSAEESTK